MNVAKRQAEHRRALGYSKPRRPKVEAMITCEKCGGRVHVTGPCPTCRKRERQAEVTTLRAQRDALDAEAKRWAAACGEADGEVTALRVRVHELQRERDALAAALRGAAGVLQWYAIHVGNQGGAKYAAEMAEQTLRALEPKP